MRANQTGPGRIKDLDSYIHYIHINRNSKYGDLAVECAPFYFEYGRALLEISRATQSILGEKAAAAPEPAEGEDASDMEIAWEVLEAARVIYQKELSVADSKVR